MTGLDAMAGPAGATAATTAMTSASASATADPAPVAAAELVVILEHRTERQLVAREVSLLIGRGDDADLRLEHASVSRRHARLSSEGGLLRLSELRSRNGVLVNGRRLAAGSCVTLHAGDTLTLGAAVVIVTATRAPRPRPTCDAGAAARLEQGLDRALATGRPLALALIDARDGRVDAALAHAIDDAAWRRGAPSPTAAATS